MTPLALYSVLRREEALRAFADPRPLLVGPAGKVGWWISKDALVCFAVVARDYEVPGLSHFTTARRFEWASPVPGSSLPIELQAFKNGDRSLHVFVGRAADDAFTYIGESEPSYSGTIATWWSADFVLKRSVPVEILVRLGTLPPIESTEALEALLLSFDTLAPVDRLATIRAFVEYWWGPLRAEDGVPASELAGRELPDPLRWYLSIAGRRTDVFVQNRLLGLDQLTLKDDRLVFSYENQGVWEAATATLGEDPPVWARMVNAWVDQGVTLSSALLGLSMLDAIIRAPYGDWAFVVSEEDVAWLASHLEEVPGVGFHLEDLPSRYFVGEGAFAAVLETGDCGIRMYIGAKTDGAVSFLAERAGIWENERR